MKIYHFKVCCAFKHGAKYLENINSLAGREEVSIQHNQRPLYLQGPLGDSGADGRSGLKGPRGYRGSVGPTGDRGEEGETVSDDRQLVGYYWTSAYDVQSIAALRAPRYYGHPIITNRS